MLKPVTVHLIGTNQMGSFYFTSDAVNLARHSMALGHYTPVECLVYEGLDGEDVAEEVFDLTNNPGRQGDRVVKYGFGRSVSVGDMVEVDGVRWLCRPNGWVEVPEA